MMTTPSSPIEPDPRDLLQALDAIAILDEVEREAWMRAHEAGHPDLVARLRVLLADAGRLDALEQGPAMLAADLADTHGMLEPGTRLGPWRLGEVLGHGGMGRVYLAERDDGAFEKKVAIKVLRRERRLPDAIIEHERALLARLEHPGLTRLLDGGISADGDMYLVMELVEGQPLEAWCRAHQPDLSTRLDLFTQILDAVDYAHRQLVVHGDLKPSNIIVDAEGRVRVLDFGVARMLSNAPEKGTMHAATPGWMPPEGAHALPIVTSDIHNLGRLLQHLAGEVAPTDLACIIRHAMADDPEARYATVTTLSQDLARFRGKHPVHARDGGRFYRLRRFTQRHWAGVAFATVAICLLTASVTVVTWQNQRVRIERDNARVAAARSQVVLDWLLGVFGQAGDSGPDASLPVGPLLYESLNHIDSDLPGDPQARQALRVRLSELMIRLNDFATARRLLQEVDDRQLHDMPALLRARALDNLALVQIHEGDLEQAEALVRDGLGLLVGGRDNQREQTSQLLVTLAQIQNRKGDTETSIDTLRRARSLRLAVSGPNAAQTVVVRNSLAVALMRHGAYADALREFRTLEKALQASRRQNSLDAATIHNNHAATAFSYGLLDEAETHFDRALDLQRRWFGPSAAQAASLSNHGKLALARGSLSTGAARIETAYAMMRKYTGENSIDTQLIGMAMAQSATANGDYDESRAILARVTTILGNKLSPAHPILTAVHAQSLIVDAEQDRASPDDPDFEKTVQILRKAGMKSLAARLSCRHGRLALEHGRMAPAARSVQTCLDIHQLTQAPSSPRLAYARFLDAEVRYRSTPTKTRRSVRDAALTKAQATLASDHPRHHILNELASR